VLGEDAGWIGTDQKVIAVELEAWPILIVVITELAGESGKQEILSVVIRHQRVLMPVVKRVEQAVRFLFGLVEDDEVELVTIGQTRSK